MTTADTTTDFAVANKAKIAEIEAAVIKAVVLSRLQITNIVGDNNKIRYGIELRDGQYSGREKWHLEAKPDHQTGKIGFVFRDYRNFDELQEPEISKPENIAFGHNTPVEHIVIEIAAFMRSKMMEDEEKLAVQKGITAEELEGKDSEALDASMRENFYGSRAAQDAPSADATS